VAVLDEFLWSFGASVAVELYTAQQLGIQPDGRYRLPPRYRRVLFLAIRFILALAARGLAVAHNVQTILLAINIGALAPLILQGLARQAPPPPPEP